MFTALQYCTMYGFAAVALTPNLMAAAVLSSAFYGVWNLTAGFIIPEPVGHNFCTLLQCLMLTVTSPTYSQWRPCDLSLEGHIDQYHRTVISKQKHPVSYI